MFFFGRKIKRERMAVDLLFIEVIVSEVCFFYKLFFGFRDDGRVFFFYSGIFFLRKVKENLEFCEFFLGFGIF